MSANVDLVRSIYADWERGEFFGGSGEWIDPEIEFVVDGGPEPGRWTGIDGLIEGARTILSAWEDWRPEAAEYRELDKERVLVLFHPRARGKTSGLDIGNVAEKRANLFQVRGGKVTRLVAYWDLDRALADLGLTE
jgi:ketosteroid isomerase-like protein